MDLVTDRSRAGARLGDHAWLTLPPVDLAALVMLLYRHTNDPDVRLDLALADRPVGGLRVQVEPAESIGGLRVRLAGLTARPDQAGAPVLFAETAVAGADEPALAGIYELVLAGDQLGYQPALFDRSSAVRLAAQLARIAAADPAVPVADIELLDEPERLLVRDRFNDTDRPYPRTATVHGLFRERARAHPDVLAVSDQHGTISYAELDRRSDLLAGRLRAAGVKAGDPVGLLVQRSPAMVVATLGILKAGGCYLPIDPGYPVDRIGFQLSDSGAAALVSDLAVDFALPVLAVDGPGKLLETSDQTADNIAYLMYTSGTTGRPKGVQVRHRGVVRLVRNPDYLDFGPDTRMLAVSSICFDAATFELWGPLLNGGSLHLADSDTVLDAGALGRLLRERAITTLLLIAPVFNHLVEQDPAVFRPLRELMVGGDALSARHLAAVMTACPQLVLINGYGPTENTTLGSTHRLNPDDLGRIPIGRPVANSRCYVLDPAGRLCPIGMPGELFLGGDGVARGYLNRPELTAAAFRPDPFRPGGQLFGTGDLARWRPDGVLEFFGRRDRQVKVRGFRIELGEVEHALRSHPAVADAVVLDRPRGADRYLVGYHVADRPLPAAELRAHLRDLLPEHMLPAAFVQLAAMPLNTSGKIATDRLPEPVLAADPGDEESTELLGLIRTVLPGIGLDEELPDAGADSFIAAMLADRIAAGFGVRLPASTLLRGGPVRRLAELIADGAPSNEPTLTRAPDAPDHPLSPQQRRLYVEQLKDPSAVHYNVPVLLPLPAGLTVPELTTALRRLAERHEALRTEFVLHGGEVRQRIVPAVDPELSVEDPAEARSMPFELGRAPLWRATVSPDAGSLLLDLHHLIVDGVSLAVLAADLLELCADREPPTPVLRYRDYARHLTEQAPPTDRQGYWQQAFAGPRRRPDLPLDEPRPPIRSLAGGELACTIDALRTAELRELARRTGGTLFTVLAAGLATLLAELTGEPDVTLGAPVAGRTLPGTDRIVGIFANTICLRILAKSELSFEQLIRAVTETAELATLHQDYPLESLAAALEPGRDYRRHPMFDALIAFHSARYLSVQAADRTVRLRPRWNGQTPFDLNLQVYEEPDGLRISLQYSATLLRPATVAGWRDRWLELLSAAIADPTIRLAELTAAGRTVPELEFDL